MPLVKPRPARPMPIRMTPLIDVVFILLVFFMVTSYLLPTGYLELENDTAPGRGVDGEALPQLQLLASGEVRWQERNWQPRELSRQLLGAGHREVRLATEGEVALERFTLTLSELDNAGIDARWKRSPPDSTTTSTP
ncbi:ExbD/TolR family protein [Marinobacter lacisalsi]|uniref:ExbD/TolR family protein n=1 Tax=Marinobacter lacisalsi TaxID=475979 RepID=A0ABV8QD92_9GAMM